jgi:hypothetical protein
MWKHSRGKKIFRAMQLIVVIVKDGMLVCVIATIAAILPNNCCLGCFFSPSKQKSLSRFLQTEAFAY